MFNATRAVTIPDGKQGMFVKDFKANEWILCWDQKAGMTWLWGMYPAGGNGSRLVTRVRVRYHWRSAAAVFNVLIEFGDIVMMRKCLLGIKQRAEPAQRFGPSAATPAQKSALLIPPQMP